jgi:hypothetical protein
LLELPDFGGFPPFDLVLLTRKPSLHMSHYSNWKFRPSQSVSALYLDEVNPRQPLTGKNPSQSELILDLLENDDVLQLAKHISTHGFFPPSDIIVMPRKDKANQWTVLEGNRRLAALKILINPDLASPSMQSRFRTLSASADLTAIRKINVWQVPDRPSAEIYLAMKHSPPEKGLMEEWTPMQKAAFYGRFQKELTVDEIAKRFATTTANMASHLRRNHLYEIARRLPLEGPAMKFWQPRKFPVSIIERIVAAPAARKLLKLKPLSDGSFEIDATAEGFLTLYHKILDAIAKGDFDTRTLDTPDDIERELRGLMEDKPLKKPSKATTSSEILEGRKPIEEGPARPERPAKPDPAPPNKPKKPVKRFGNGVFAEKLVSSLKDDRLPSLLTELQTVDSKHCNATGMLLRSTVEVALIGWLKANGQWKAVCANAKSKNIGPMLSEMAKHVTNLNQFTPPLDAQEKRALVGLLDKGDMDTLNGWVHNPNYPADPAGVLAICTRLRPLLERLLSGK